MEEKVCEKGGTHILNQINVNICSMYTVTLIANLCMTVRLTLLSSTMFNNNHTSMSATNTMQH